MQSKKIPFFLGHDDQAIFCMLSLPNDLAIRDTGIIICNACGHEYTHSHSGIRHLTQQLSNEGFATLRFDYNGTGDSPGSAFSESRISCWLNNIEQAIITLKKLTHVKHIALCGLRMGGSLASLYSEQNPVDYLILWNPCTIGKAYIRDMQILNEYGGTKTSNHGIIDSGGFIITAETAKDYDKINLFKTNYQVIKNVLLINRDDIPNNNRLSKHITSLKINIDEIDLPGYASMMQQPQFSISPDATINHISQWLKQNSNHEKFEINGPGQPNTQLTSNQESFHESICQFGKNNTLFGILCRPTSDIAPNKPLILISNTGAAHHIGPNRLHVELCRSLANLGFASMRFDLANLGDSVSRRPANENHPYPKHANEDMHSALTFLKNKHGFTRIIPAGLCSGANAAFHCALNNKDFDIPEAILINPLIFYWQEGLSLATPETVKQATDQKYYARSMRDPKKWLKLIKGQTNIHYILRFIGKKINHIVSKPIKHFAEIIGLKAESKLAQDLKRYTALRRHISLFISSGDPGYDIMISEAGGTAKRKIKHAEMDIYFIKDADHTFIAKAHRDQLINQFLAHLAKRYTQHHR